MFTLVTTQTEDKLKLSGLFSEGKKELPVVLHIHGFEGDFFTNTFVPSISQTLKNKDISFLTVQTRGMANEYLLKKTDGSWGKYGAHFELLEDAYKDIDAWIRLLLDKGFTNILLQGHSLGTMKVIRYLFEGTYSSRIQKLILLAPFDMFQLLDDATKGKWKEYYKVAKKEVAEGKGEDIIPTEFLDVPMSYQTYVSHHEQNDYEQMFAFSNKDYTFPLLQKIHIPVLALVGSKDEYFHPSNPEHPEEAMQILTKHIKQCSGTIIEGAEHGFDGYEEIVSKEVVLFIKR